MPERNRFGHAFKLSPLLLIGWALIRSVAHSQPLLDQPIRVAVTNDRVSMAVDQRPRSEAIAALAGTLNLKLTVAGLDDQPISVKFDGLSPHQALSRVIGPLSFTLFIDREANKGWLAIHEGADEAVSMFRTVPDPTSSLERVSALADSDGAANVDIVYPFLDAKNWAVRAEAAHALGETESPDATILLGTLLQDSHPKVRQAAVDALMDQGHDAAADLLGNALYGASERLQLDIIDALNEMGTETSRSHLLRTAQSEASDTVREAANEALSDG